MSVMLAVLLWGMCGAYAIAGIITAYDAWKMREPLMWLLPPLWLYIAWVCAYAAVTS